jgi:hypothetical protein
MLEDMTTSLLGLVIAAAILALMGATAWRYGADSRDGRDWRIDRPLGPDGPAYRRAHTLGADLASLRRRIGRLMAGIADLHRDQVTMWEHYFAVGRPWERDLLRWVRTGRGWVLRGHVAPPLPDREERIR